MMWKRASMNYYDRLAKHVLFRKKGSERNEVFFAATVGSMNYGLDDEKSDCDCKIVLVPKMGQILKWADEIHREDKAPRSKDIISQYDMRNYFLYLMKMNPNFIETLFARAHYVNHKYKEEFDMLLAMRDEIAYCTPLSSIRTMRSMMKNEYQKLVYSHGEDSKAAYHCIRIGFMLSDYYRGKDYGSCLLAASDTKSIKKLVLSIKNGEKKPSYVLSFCDSMIKNEQAEYDFFVCGSGPKEYEKGYLLSDTENGVRIIETKVLLKSLADMYKVVVENEGE